MDALQQAIDNRKSDPPEQPEKASQKHTIVPDENANDAPQSDDGKKLQFQKIFNKINNQQVKLFQQDVDFDLQPESHVDPVTGKSREFMVCKKYRGSAPEVRVPDGVQFIAEKAFKDDKSVFHVELPQSLEIIQNQAFENCKNLHNIIFGDGLRYIGYRAFADCASLETIELPETATTLGAQIFCGCLHLKHIGLPSQLLKIPDESFKQCIELQTIRWPAQMPQIGNNIFAQSFTDAQWDYFDLKDGICTRIRGDIQNLPSTAIQLLYEESSFERHTITNLMVWSTNVSPLQSDKTALRLTVISESLEMAAILTGADNYAALELIDNLYEFLLHNIDVTTESIQTCLHAAFILVLLSVSHSGRSLYARDNRLCEDLREYFHMNSENDIPLLMCPEELQNRLRPETPPEWIRETPYGPVIRIPQTADEDDKSRLKWALRSALLSQIGIEVTTVRYNPKHLHYAAYYTLCDDYWLFVHAIEGLLRSLSLNPDHYEVECPPQIAARDWGEGQDNLDVFCALWSKALWENELVIVILKPRATDLQFLPWDLPDLLQRRYIALATESQAQHLMELLDKYKCRSMADVWQDGEKMISLRFV